MDDVGDGSNTPGAVLGILTLLLVAVDDVCGLPPCVYRTLSSGP